MPKRTKKKTSVKQKQKVKVIVNVNNKTAKAKQGRRSSATQRQPQQPQQIIIQQPSMVSRELPMPMFNPIQQASAPPVFQGVGQSLQTPSELLNVIRQAPEFENLNRILNIQANNRQRPNFENYNRMPYMETNLRAPQFEDPAEIQREVIDTTPIFQEPSSFDAKLQARFEKAMENRRRNKNNNSFINVNATNKGFEEPVPREVALQEMMKGLSFDPLVKAKPKISFSPVPTPVPSEDGNSVNEDVVVPPVASEDENAVVPPVVTSDKKRRGRPKITPPTINQGKIDSDIYNTIINAEDDEFASDKLFPLKELNKLLAGIGIDPEDFDYRYQKVNRLKQWRNEQRS